MPAGEKAYRRAGEFLFALRAYTQFGQLRVDASQDCFFHFTFTFLGDQDWWDCDCVLDFGLLGSDAPLEPLAKEIMRRWRLELAGQPEKAQALVDPEVAEATA